MNFLKKHKFFSIFLIAIFVFSGYYAWGKITSKTAEARYVIGEVKKTTIITTVTGSGQISPFNQIDIKSKASGDVKNINVKNGDLVKADFIIAELDSRDIQKTIRDAEVGLESTKIALEKLKLDKSNINLNEDLNKAYDDGFNNVSNAFLDLPSVMSGLSDILFTSTFSSGQWNIDYYTDSVNQYDSKASQYRDDMNRTYKIARDAYDKNFDDYKIASRFNNKSNVEILINETYETTRAIAEAVKSANNLIQFYQDTLPKYSISSKPIPASNTHLASLNTFTSKTNSHLLNLLSIKQSIKNYKDAFINADLDIRSQELSVEQRENSLLDAKEKLNDYFIRSPFTGVVATLNIKNSDSVSNGANIATLITKKKIAEISLSEVDIAKLEVGAKATLTFDAIEKLSLTGKVVEIDSVGTVSQGVVTYGVKIEFDTEDIRVKSGMSVSADIITEVRRDVLSLPAGAIKSQGEKYYVEILSTKLSEAELSASAIRTVGITSVNPPQNQKIEVGISNDISTEIIDGLSEGDQVIIKTISIAAQATPKTATPTLFGAPTGNRTTTGNVRIQR